MPSAYRGDSAALWSGRAGHLRAERLRAGCLAHEGTDGRRMRPAAHRHQRDLAPELRLDQRPADDAGMIDRVLGHETEAQSQCHHGKDPVIALAAVDSLEVGTALAPDRSRIAV